MWKYDDQQTTLTGPRFWLTVLKAQQDPQLPCIFTGVTQFSSLQSTASGSLAPPLCRELYVRCGAMALVLLRSMALLWRTMFRCSSSSYGTSRTTGEELSCVLLGLWHLKAQNQEVKVTTFQSDLHWGHCQFSHKFQWKLTINCYCI